MKTKIQKIIICLPTYTALLLVVAVLLLATHARDIAGALPRNETTDQTTKTTNLVAKAVGDLHNHTDKTFVKHFGDNGGSDQGTLNARRQSEDISEEYPIAMRVIEMMLLVRLAYAHAFAR